MPNFWSLPKPVREKIYRMHLVHDEPVNLETFQELCAAINDEPGFRCIEQSRMMPCLLSISRDMEREGEHEQIRSRHLLGRPANSISAAHIFFRENTFVIENGRNVSAWISKLYLHHARFIRKMVLGRTGPVRYDLRDFFAQDFDRLQSLFSLESLTIILSEETSLHSCLIRPQTKIAWHGSLALGPQMYLQILHIRGMTGLRSLRNLRLFEIIHPDHKEQKPGSLPDGFLETTIRREIKQPQDASA
jgi:hypothetical protein